MVCKVEKKISTMYSRSIFSSLCRLIQHASVEQWLSTLFISQMTTGKIFAWINICLLCLGMCSHPTRVNRVTQYALSVPAVPGAGSPEGLSAYAKNGTIRLTLAQNAITFLYGNDKVKCSLPLSETCADFNN